MNDPNKNLPPIRVSEYDLDRLEQLLDKLAPRPEFERLREELDRADVLEPEDMPPDVVTMNSQIRFSNAASGEESEITLVFPDDADAGQGRISILAPVGMALIGLTVGATIDWPMPGGRTRRLRVVSITYQPEAAGDSHL